MLIPQKRGSPPHLEVHVLLTWLGLHHDITPLGEEYRDQPLSSPWGDRGGVEEESIR